MGVEGGQVEDWSSQLEDFSNKSPHNNHLTHHSSESALVSLSPPEHSALLLLAMAGALSSAEGIAAMLDIKTEPELK